MLANIIEMINRKSTAKIYEPKTNLIKVIK